MSTFLSTMIEKAQSQRQTIVLPEAQDKRILQASETILKKGIAHIILIGDPEEIAAHSYDLSGAKIINNLTDPLREELSAKLYDLRKEKGMTPDEAMKLMDNKQYFATMLLKEGYADGLVSGATYATKEVLSPAFKIIKSEPGCKLVSSFFVMEVPNCAFGAKGTFAFGDCAVCVQPSPEELASIAVSTARSFHKLCDIEPKVALLSHSSYGSAKNDDSDKVTQATKIAQALAPDLEIDGELQADAALVPSVGSSKAPTSPVAGQANVLIFPDLDSGNIGYKLVQRLGQAQAYGPVLQGLKKPVNDLSRGCSAEDIVGVVAITSVQSQNL